ncbi:MAG: hypothetical protein CBB68_09075 [Rhodospirillaceae bacterium TMED8]|nr:hypothetical protein [Magnetovibrio sp.]OUT50511.1 MAG: hypothetical protein CBB68_09075 [Rhodospirillaceae bacterium TMED8]|tara:strand:- start:1981 stop:3588 length:1608 start_codon:yes stop_codon:yes gene_type:complete
MTSNTPPRLTQRRKRRDRLKKREDDSSLDSPTSTSATTPIIDAKLASTQLKTKAERPYFKYLSDTKIEILRNKAFDLLAKHGVFINHDQMASLLVKAGAVLDTDGLRVRLPSELVSQALQETPKTLTLFSKSGAHNLALPRIDGTFHMRTGTGAHGYIDPFTSEHRKLTLDDAKGIARIGEGLPEIGFIAHPFVNGVPEITSDLHGFAAVAGTTEKHNWIQPYNAENVSYLMRVAAIAAGGEENLRARPSASCIACSFTPLEFKRMDVEAILQSAFYGVPIHACSLPTAGGTSPITMSATVLMAAAEILAMVTMAHVAGPTTPVIATPLIFALDVRTGRSLQSSVEAMTGISMAVQLMKQGFGLLTHTYGSGSDTPDTDGQSQAERAMICNQVALAKADILGGVGQLECATVFSPAQAVMDNELGAMMRRYLASPSIDDETLNWSAMLEIELGGHFLANEHTLKYCRHNLDPGVFLRLARDSYTQVGHRDALDNARIIAQNIINAPFLPGTPDEDQRRDMAAIVAAGDAHITGAI